MDPPPRKIIIGDTVSHLRKIDNKNIDENVNVKNDA
jgi:hypothetical protein